jgi:hypothetical protein
MGEIMADHLTITVNDVTTIHDETDGLQNDPPNLDATNDLNGNDIAVASLPTVFSDRLTDPDLNADPTGAIGAALSGYDGSNDGLDVITVTAGPGFDIDNLALTDTNGDALDGDDSGLTTTDGDPIFLYTDPDNDNIVLGRKGTMNGETEAIGDAEAFVADPDGEIVFAIYLDESTDLTAAKIWTVQYEALAHPDAGDGTDGSHDEVLSLANTLFVTASRDLEFDLTNAPSGQNLFIMFGDGNITDGDAEVAIVATGKNPANQSAGESITTGDTVNTSQAGVGDATFGINNQMLTASTVPGEGDGIYFTFVTGPNPDFTVPNLSQTEADVEANIDFNGFLNAKGAEFQVVQLQGGKTADVKISAFNETQPLADASGANFVDGLNNDAPVDVLNVQVVDFDGGGEISIVDHSDGTFTIEGVEAGDTIRYFTDGDHNRVLIENVGDGKGQDSADFDIGGFKLVQADFVTANAGFSVQFEDDGPTIDIELSGAILSTDDRSLTGGSGLPDAGTATDTGMLTTALTNDPGADGQQSLVYTLGVSAAGVDSGVDDVATGNDIFLYLENGAVVGRVGMAPEPESLAEPAGAEAFRVTVDGTTGAVTLTQSRAIEHGTAETNAGAPDYYTTDVESLIADTVTLTATLTDGDLDVATDTVNIGDKLSFTDDGPQVELGAMNGVTLDTYDSGTNFPAPGNTSPTDTTDSITLDALLGGESSATGADGGTINYALTLTTQGLGPGRCGHGQQYPALQRR